MNSWTDIGLIVAIVIGLISAASLPMVSVNAVSPESLRLHAVANDEPSPWALVSQGKLEAWEPSPMRAVGAAKAPLSALDPRAAKATH